MTSYEISLAVVGPHSVFPCRRYLAVPNLSWGLLNWEADLAVMAPSGYLYEVEIKVSHSDLKADFDKIKHRSNTWSGGFGGDGWKLIRGFYYAMPEKLHALMTKAGTTPPPYAGVITVSDEMRCKVVRQCATNTNARKLTDGEQFTLARLGVMRYWSRRESRAEKLLRKSKHRNGSSTRTPEKVFKRPALEDDRG